MKALYICMLVICILLQGCADKGKLLTQKEYGEEWPLTVEECYVNCTGDYAIVVQVDGKVYAVNEAARKMEQFENIDEITRINPNYPGEKVRMKLSEIEFEGLKLCK